MSVGRVRSRGAIVGLVLMALVAIGALAGDDEPASRSASVASTTTEATIAAGGSTTPIESTPPAVSLADGIPPIPVAPATALVDGLTVAADVPVADYRRDAFGNGWDYDPVSGCNTRERVLIEESLTEPTMGDRCKPLVGDWVSIYDGLVTDDPADLEIDHLVALSNAWRSGAALWTDERREVFANDRSDPDTLVAVSTSSNRSKSDSSPDRWLPERNEARCDYVEAWVRVKSRWELSVTPAEKSTLVQVLSGC